MQVALHYSNASNAIFHFVIKGLNELETILIFMTTCPVLALIILRHSLKLALLYIVSISILITQSLELKVQKSMTM